MKATYKGGHQRFAAQHDQADEQRLPARITFDSTFGGAAESGVLSGAAEPGFLNLIVNAGRRLPTRAREVRTRPKTGMRGDMSDRYGLAESPEAVRPKIFAAGFTTKPMGEGTGLGLTITREIVEDTHGGTIDFETEVDKGNDVSRAHPD